MEEVLSAECLLEELEEAIMVCGAMKSAKGEAKDKAGLKHKLHTWPKVAAGSV